MISSFRIWLTLTIAATLILTSIETAVHICAAPQTRSPEPALHDTPTPRADGPRPAPGRSEPPPGRVGTQLGPIVPDDAWIEAEVAASDAAPWRLFLARSSADDALLLDFGAEHARAVLRAHGVDTIVGRAALSSHGAQGLQEVWTRRRGATWSVWISRRAAFTFQAKAGDDARSGFHNDTPGPDLRRLSVRACAPPVFSDDFMREGPDDTWRALSGEWELSGIRFPEHSANPFALRARFRSSQPRDMFVRRRWKRPRTGLGVNLSSWRGLVDVERITGGGPAAQAGVEEHDIVIAVDGMPHLAMGANSFHEDLIGPPGSRVKLTLLKRGADAVTDVTLTRRMYRWAQAGFGQPVPGSRPPGSPRDVVCLAAAGMRSWDDYRFEASVCPIRDGGAGVAFAVRSELDYHVFATGVDGDTTRLALARVRDGVPTILAERRWAPRPQTYYRMAIDLTGTALRAFVDGELALEAARSDLPAGRIGLWARAPSPDASGLPWPRHVAGAYFDDVAVSHDPSATAGERGSRASPALATEVDMRRWANPADEWELDHATGWWHETFRFPGGASLAVSRDARFATLDAVLGAKEDDVAGGVAFRIKPAAGTCTVSYRGAKVASVEGLHGTYEYALSLDGSTARVLIDGAERASCTFAPPPAGDRLAVRGLENLSGRGVLTATSKNVYEYHFRHAPVDWAAESGRWGMLNKWICDPRFSWFGGHGRSLAAIWNKRRTTGDVSLDFYAALVMTSDDPPYERVGDFACTILADGKDLASGYTLVVSGGRNEWSRLYGGGKLLAETRDIAKKLPSNVTDSPDRRALHQRWFRVTLERVDGRVRALLDGTQILACPDTLARDSGYAALWTQDNGMLVARARLAADRIAETRDSLTAWGSRARVRRMHGLANTAFGEVTTDLAIDATGPGASPAVRVTNAACGGLFAASAVGTASATDVISFQFRAEKGSRVDLYLVPDGSDPLSPGPERVRLTGPASEHERHPVLWRAPVRADGAWHRVEVDLHRIRQRWRAARYAPWALDRRRVRPVFANLEDGEGDEYLPAGMGGNARGSRYWVSGLSIEPRTRRDVSPPRVKRILLPGEGGTPEGVVRVLFEDDHCGVEDGTILVALDRGVSPADAPEQTRPTHKILPPSMVEITPRNRPRPAPRSSRPGVTLVRRGNPAFSFDSVTQELRIDLAGAIGATSDGAGLTVEVRTYADGAGRQGTPATRASATGRTADTTPPAITYLAFDPAIGGEVDIDFEPSARTRRELAMRASGRAPVMWLDSSTAAGGATSLKLTAPGLASAVIFRVSERTIDLARFKELAFDYRLGPQMPVNLVVRGSHGYSGVLFTDRADPFSERSRGMRYVGEVADVRTDMEWHHAAIPLDRFFGPTFPGPPGVAAHGIYLMDWGWTGLWPGDSWWIDNLQMLGVRRGGMLSARWRALDSSGATEAAWVLDDRPDTTVDPAAADLTAMSNGGGRVTLRGAHRLPDGGAYFHLAVKDAHGNWSGTVHKRLLVDNTPPDIVRVEPADGAVSASRIVRIVFADYAGLDPGSAVLKLDVTREADGTASSQAFRVDGRACSYDAATGTMTLRLRAAHVTQALAGRAQLKLSVLGARDRVGNARRTPYAWSWTFDTSVDRTPPPAPRLRVTTCRPYEGYHDGPTFGDTNDFERELGPVEGYRGCTVALSTSAACFGTRGARCAITHERGGAFSLRLRERYWYTDRRRYLTFMYRLPPRGVDTLSVEVDLLRASHRIPIHGPEAGVDLIADGAWHRAVVDMGRHVAQSRFEFVRYRGAPLKIAAWVRMSGRGSPGAAFDIDDLEFVLADWRGLSLVVDHDADDAGIDALSLVWDRMPDTVPPKSVSNPLPPLQGDTLQRLPIPRNVMSGRMHLHVRSRDGAGNWSEAGHLEVDFRGR